MTAAQAVELKVPAPRFDALSIEQLATVDQAASLLGVERTALQFMVRTSSQGGISYEGFRWHGVGDLTVADDFKKEPCCGYGLHGYPMGSGQCGQLDKGESALWQVVAVVLAELVHVTEDDTGGLDGKHKAPRAVAVYAGPRAEATAWLLALGADPGTIPGGTVGATGYSGAASATGDSGAASATGYRGAASATGYRGAASATGDSGAASATGYRGAASATGYSGAASATGYSGAASATGDSGAASATGKHAVALARNAARAGELGMVICLAWDESTRRWRAITGYVGEEGIEPGQWYRGEWSKGKGKLVAIEQPAWYWEPAIVAPDESEDEEDDDEDEF
jgi:hypothetical protein